MVDVLPHVVSQQLLQRKLFPTIVALERVFIQDLLPFTVIQNCGQPRDSSLLPAPVTGPSPDLLGQGSVKVRQSDSRTENSQLFDN